MKDPYISKIDFYKSGKEERSDTEGQIVDVLDLASDERGLSLMPQKTRVLCKNEIHELITTDEVDAGPNKTIKRVDYIGLFEVTRGGVIIEGDAVVVNNKEIGKIAGFDETHFPNHYNIVLLSHARISGYEAGIHLGDKVKIVGQSQKGAIVPNQNRT